VEAPRAVSIRSDLALPGSRSVSIRSDQETQDEKKKQLAPRAYPQKDSVVARGSLLPQSRTARLCRSRIAGSHRASGCSHLAKVGRPTCNHALVLHVWERHRQVARPQNKSVVGRTIALTSPLAPLPARPCRSWLLQRKPSPRRWLVSSADGLSRSKISLPRSICHLPLPTDRPAASVRLCRCPACPWR
jgi:hypothetical protein